MITKIKEMERGYKLNIYTSLSSLSEAIKDEQSEFLDILLLKQIFHFKRDRVLRNG